MIDTYPYLAAVRDAIEAIGIFKSVKIGLEKGADRSINCPFVRVVQEAEEYRGSLTDLIVQIVVVYDTKNDLEALYKEFNEALFAIKKSLFGLPCKVELLDSFFDEDRLINLKAGVLRVRLFDLGES